MKNILVNRLIHLCLLTSLFIHIVVAAAPADLGIECTVLNVGQGSAAVIRDKQTNKTFIVDAGCGQLNDILLTRFKNAVFASKKPFRKLAGILISHSDDDHVKLLATLIKNNSSLLKSQNRLVKNKVAAYLGSPYTGYLKTDSSNYANRCLKALIDVKSTIHFLSHVIDPKDCAKTPFPGGSSPAPRPFFMNVLIPEFTDNSRNLLTIIMAANASHTVSKFVGTIANPGMLTDAVDSTASLAGGTNDNGAMLKLTHNGKSVVFPGDIDGKGTDALLRDATDADSFISTNFLLAAHHGAASGETNNIAWLLMSSPQSIYISAGEHKGHKHPRLTSVASMASILILETNRVPEHWIQVYSEGAAHLKDNAKLKKLFDAAAIQEKSPNSGWLRIKTKLPIFTTPDSKDIIFDIK